MEWLLNGNEPRQGVFTIDDMLEGKLGWL
jgi:hypothetical protein